MSQREGLLKPITFPTRLNGSVEGEFLLSNVMTSPLTSTCVLETLVAPLNLSIWAAHLLFLHDACLE